MGGGSLSSAAVRLESTTARGWQLSAPMRSQVRGLNACPAARLAPAPVLENLRLWAIWLSMWALVDLTGRMSSDFFGFEGEPRWSVPTCCCRPKSVRWGKP